MELLWERFPARQTVMALAAIAVFIFLPHLLQSTPLLILRAVLLAVLLYNIVHGVALWTMLFDSRNISTADSHKLLAASSKEGGSKVGLALSSPYYDIVTDWYEFGWGDSFQLGGAQGRKGESFVERLRRHDFWFAHRAGIRKGQRWLDLGCGIGGPMRNIARFTEAEVVGVNLNLYQLMKAKALLEREGMDQLCSLLHSDFKDLDKHTAPNQFDGAYSLEALCHAEELEPVLKHVARTLKPGGTYCTFEWLLTDDYNSEDPIHRRCKRAVEVFGGLGCLRTISQFKACAVKAGLVLEEEDDFGRLKQRHFYPESWHETFDPKASILNFHISQIGIKIAYYFLSVLEFLRILPSGASSTHKTICSNIPDVRLSGELGIFTPHYFSIWRKPKAA